MVGHGRVGVCVVPARRQDDLGVFELRGHESPADTRDGRSLANAVDPAVRQAFGQSIEAVGVDAQAITLEAGVGGGISLVDIERNARAAQALRQAQAAQTRADDVDMQD